MLTSQMVQYHEIAAHIFLTCTGRENWREVRISRKKKWLVIWTWWTTELKVCIISMRSGLEFRREWWGAGWLNWERLPWLSCTFFWATGIERCTLKHHLAIQNKDEIFWFAPILTEWRSLHGMQLGRNTNTDMQNVKLISKKLRMK